MHYLVLTETNKFSLVFLLFLSQKKIQRSDTTKLQKIRNILLRPFDLICLLNFLNNLINEETMNFFSSNQLIKIAVSQSSIQKNAIQDKQKCANWSTWKAKGCTSKKKTYIAAGRIGIHSSVWSFFRRIETVCKIIAWFLNAITTFPQWFVGTDLHFISTTI